MSEGVQDASRVRQERVITGTVKRRFLFGVVAMAAVAIAVYVGSYLRLPFVDRDTVLYVMIGRALVGHGVLPYGAIFDHKPILLYAVYGVWDAIAPLQTGLFTVLALAAVALSGALARLWHYRWADVVLALLVLGAPFELLGGNTELVLLPMVFSALILLGHHDLRFVVLGGLMGGLALEVNYLAAPCLALPALITLKDRWLRRLAMAVLGGIIGFALPLLPYLALPGRFEDYLTLQWRYLSHYGEGTHARESAGVLLMGWTLCAAPLLLLGGSRRWLLSAWAAGGLVACLASGHPYPHYFLLVLLPALLAGLPIQGGGWSIPRGMAFLPLVLFGLYGMVRDTRHNLRETPRLQRLEVASLRQIVGTSPVLSIETTPVPVFLAGLTPQGHFLFPHHVARLYGAGAERYYLGQLAQQPAYVLTPSGFCPDEAGMPAVCAVLRASYRQRLHTTGTYGYSLFVRQEKAGQGFEPKQKIHGR